MKQQQQMKCFLKNIKDLAVHRDHWTKHLCPVWYSAEWLFFDQHNSNTLIYGVSDGFDRRSGLYPSKMIQRLACYRFRHMLSIVAALHHFHVCRPVTSTDLTGQWCFVRGGISAPPPSTYVYHKLNHSVRCAAANTQDHSTEMWGNGLQHPIPISSFPFSNRPKWK